MKPVPPDFPAFVQSRVPFAIGELYTIQFGGLIAGDLDFFTSLDLNVVYGGNVYKANTLQFSGMKFKIAVGTQVDEQELKINAYPGQELNGADFFAAVSAGQLDGAYISRQRAFWVINGNAFQTYSTAPIAVVTLFTGRVSTISKIGRTHVEMKLKSPLSLLDTDMPRNSWGPGCMWTLFDAGCTVVRSTFSVDYTVASATNLTIVPTIPIAPDPGADGLPYFAQGRLRFTSGALNDTQVVIANNDGATLFMQYPFITPPSPGDTFTASAGCSKTASTCDLKFANLQNFRGFPRVPPMNISV